MMSSLLGRHYQVGKGENLALLKNLVGRGLHAVYLIPDTPFKGLVLFYLLTVIYDVTVAIKIYVVT